jgi:hypothetical protein
MNSIKEAFAQFSLQAIPIESVTYEKAAESVSWLADAFHQLYLYDQQWLLHPDQIQQANAIVPPAEIQSHDTVASLLILHARGCTVSATSSTLTSLIHTTEERFIPYCYKGSQFLNSQSLLNALLIRLQLLPMYQAAYFCFTNKAVRLHLLSYPWSFTLYPCFKLQPDSQDLSRYLIPDGDGHWKYYDAQCDALPLTATQSQKKEPEAALILLFTSWIHQLLPSWQSSYFIEQCLLPYFDSKTRGLKDLDLETRDILGFISNQQYIPQDTKQGYGDQNLLGLKTFLDIVRQAREDHQKAGEAIHLAAAGNARAALLKWAEIFGNDFPTKG